MDLLHGFYVAVGGFVFFVGCLVAREIIGK